MNIVRLFHSSLPSYSTKQKTVIHQEQLSLNVSKLLILNYKMCDISQEVKDELRKFRFARNNESSALICEFRYEFMFLY